MAKLKKVNLSRFKNLKTVEIGKEDVLQPQTSLENKPMRNNDLTL